VRHIVEMHGGAVHAESEGENRGSTFVLAIPRAASTQLEPAAAASSETASCDPLTVAPRLDGLSLLVVDDEADVLELAAKILSDAGAQVVTSGSARGAMELLKRRSFDLLILDIAMPDTDGYSLMREIRSIEPAGAAPIVAIALTARAHAEEKARALAAGFQRHIVKPIEPPALVSAVAALAAERKAKTSGRAET
jgi:CheY-like chemotaxis protein